MDKQETARRVRECGERMARFVELGSSERFIYRELLILARLLDEATVTPRRVGEVFTEVPR